MRGGPDFRKWRAIVPVVVVAWFVLGGSTALAVPPDEPLPHSQFQGGDGDQDNPPPPPPGSDELPLIDWEGLQAEGRVRHAADPQPPSVGDRVFTQGSREYHPDQWTLTHQSGPGGGASPASDNIRDFYSAVDRGDNGDAFVYLAFTRQEAAGTAFAGFELNQDPRLWENSRGFDIPCRKTGDLMINFVYEGGTRAIIQARRWQTDPGEEGPHGCARSGSENVLTDSENVVQANVNGARDIPNHLPGHFGAEVPQRRFAEAAINLTQVLDILGEDCGAFASAWMRTRASHSVTSDLKDLVEPHPLQVAACKEHPKLRTRASGRVRRGPGGRLRPFRSTLGRDIWDTAVLTRGFHPTGTLRFRLYGPDQPDCTGRPVFGYRATVDGNGAYRSGSFTPTHRGTYRWVVRYSGDVNNEAAGPTKCGDPLETVVVRRARPKLTTTARPVGLVRVGQTIYDTAHLTRGFEPGGRLTFRLFGPDNRTCGGRAIFTRRVEVNGNGDYNSPDFTPTRAGTYRWVVSYSGDVDNRRAGPTACGVASETIVVRRARPTIVTEASEETAAGSPITDKALLSGGVRPRGRITFRLYGPDDEDCSGDPLHTSRHRVRGNGLYTSSPFTPTQAGTYRWIAIYSGDRNNARTATSCNDLGEDVVVGPPPPAEPELSTTASPATARAGSLIRDIAHLTGGENPGGRITFELFGPDDDNCSAPIFFSNRRVSGDGDYTSRAFRVREVGTYRWVAVYAGDARNRPAGPTDCDDRAELVTVSPAQPRIRTVAQRSALVGHTVRDGAFLSGASRPEGTITFRLFGPNDPMCSGTPAYRVRQVVVSRNGFYPSPRFRARTAGTYHWTASYSGDRNNLRIATTCGDPNESTVVLPRRPRLRTSASPPVYIHPHAGRTRAAGEEIYDSARLTRTFRGRGEIRFELFGPNDRTCSGPVIFRWVTAVRGNGIYNSERFTPTESGVYRWRATYSGDVNNRQAGPTRCRDRNERVRVTLPARPKLITTASQAITLGGAIHDTAHLTGGNNPGGTITFKLYRSESCSGRPVFTSTVNVTGNGDYTSASFAPTTAGPYRWVAKYSGDQHNHPAGPTACDDPGEKAVVRPPSITPVVPGFSTTAAQFPAGGATVYDTATLSGGVDPSGSITFELFGPDDATCSGPPVFVTRRTVLGNGDYRSASFAVPGPGVYRWVVTYSGDAMNSGAGPTTCGDPTETVSVSADPTPEPPPGPNVPPPGNVKPEVEVQPPPPPPPPPPPIVTG